MSQLQLIPIIACLLAMIAVCVVSLATRNRDVSVATKKGFNLGVRNTICYSKRITRQIDKENRNNVLN